MIRISNLVSFLREFGKVIFATVLLDIFEFDSLTTLDGFAKAEKTLSERSGKKRRVFLPALIEFIIFFRNCAVEVLRLRGLPKAPVQAIVFIATTQNQLKAIDPVKQEVGHSSFLIDHAFWYYRVLPLASLVSLFFWPCGWIQYCLKSERRKKGKHYLSRYFSYYGIYFVVRIWSLIYKPKIVILSNDHAGWFRVVNDAVRTQKIPTGYIQHACVASYFPDLAYDFSFLDGQDAAEKYNPQPEHGQVFLTGIAKFKPSKKSSVLDTNDAIGVCFNLLDTVPFISRVLNELLSRFPERKILARLHPAMSTTIPEKIKSQIDASNLEFSDPRIESSFDFTRRIQVMVCGASSIILEAAMTGTPSVAFFSKDASDVYDFVKNGLCAQANSFDELEIAISNQTELTSKKLAEKVEYYSAGFTDRRRPCAAQIIGNLLDQIGTTGKVDYSNWKPHPKFAGNTWEYELGNAATVSIKV